MRTKKKHIYIEKSDIKKKLYKAYLSFYLLHLVIKNNGNIIDP